MGEKLRTVTKRISLGLILPPLNSQVRLAHSITSYFFKSRGMRRNRTQQTPSGLVCCCYAIFVQWIIVFIHVNIQYAGTHSIAYIDSIIRRPLIAVVPIRRR